MTTFSSSTLLLLLMPLAQLLTSTATFINNSKAIILATLLVAQVTEATVEGWRRHASSGCYALSFATTHRRSKRRWKIHNHIISNHGHQKSQRQPGQQPGASAQSTTLSSVSWHQQQQHHHHHSSGRRWKSRRAKHSFLSPPNQTLSSNDEKAILLQLGYIPSNACRVSARSGDIIDPTVMTNKGCAAVASTAEEDATSTVDISAVGFGRPIAVQCYPLLVQLISSSTSSSPSTFSSNDARGFDCSDIGCKNTDDYRTDVVHGETITMKKGMVMTLSSKSFTRTTIITPFPTLYWLTCPHVSRAISELERAGYARILRERLLSLHPGDSHPNIHDYENKEENNKMNSGIGLELMEDTSSMGWESQWMKCHDEYASQRWNSLSVEDQQRLTLDKNDVEERKKRQGMRRILQYSGVAGIEYQHQSHDDDFTMANSSNRMRKMTSLPSAKCLHAHYAHYRSQLSSLNNANEGAKINRDEMAINIVGKWTHELLLERFPDILF